MTLHHFAHPLWFEKLGAFEKEENIPVFISFVETAFRCSSIYILLLSQPSGIHLYVSCFCLGIQVHIFIYFCSCPGIPQAIGALQSLLEPLQAC